MIKDLIVLLENKKQVEKIVDDQNYVGVQKSGGTQLAFFKKWSIIYIS